MRTDREIIESYIPVARYISMLLGNTAEVTVHDLSDMSHSIIFIINGYITGRKVGDGFRNLFPCGGFDQIFTGLSFTGRSVFEWNDETQKLYCSLFNIRNDKGDLIGFLGVVEDMQLEFAAMKAFQEKLHPQLPIPYEEQWDSGSSASNVVDVMLTSCLANLEKGNVKKLRKEEKIAIIESFERQNLFAIKGVVKLVAERLSISEPSVYRYLREIREEEDANGEGKV